MQYKANQNNPMKINVGCGMNYLDKFINIDFNPEVKADVYCDLTKFPLPFADNSVDYILMSHTLEHIPQNKYYGFLEELYRICKPGAILDISVPHFTSTIAAPMPYHYTQFGLDSFRTFEPVSNENKERYCGARFKVLKKELHFTFSHYENFPIVSIFRFLNPLFNLGNVWQHIMERIWPFRFDEIFYKLEAVK
jgi:predicted SAM-dependent methyltransferase